MFNMESILWYSPLNFYIMDIGGYQAVGQFFDKYMSYSMSRAMQQDMNEYNDPRNQVARLRAAGISPWNYSGDGNTAAQPVMTDSKLGESLGAIADRKLAKRQLDIQENLSNAQADQTRSQTKTIDTLLKYLDQSEQERIKNIGASTGNLLQSTEESKKRVERYDEQVDADIALKKANEAYQYAQTDNCKALTNRINRMLVYEIKEADSRIKLNNEQVAVLKTQAKLNNQQLLYLVELVSKTKKEAEKIGAEAWMQKYKNRIIDKTGATPGTPAWTAISDMVISHIESSSSTRKAERKINAIGKGEENKWQ